MRTDEDIFPSSLCFAVETNSKPGTSNLREQIAVNTHVVIATQVQLSHADGVYKSVFLNMPVIYQRCFRNQERKCAYRIRMRGVLPVPVAARSKASVCGRSPAGILGSNLTVGIDVYREYCVLFGRGL